MTDVIEPDPRAEHVRRCREKIAEHGHMVAAIGAGDTPAYAYTIGVSVRRGFEFAISGLPVEDMHNAMNALARRALADTFKPSDNLLVEGVFERPYIPRLRAVDPSQYGEFGWIGDVLNPETPPVIWQAQFSTRDHKYPGDAGYDLDDAQADYSQPGTP